MRADSRRWLLVVIWVRARFSGPSLNLGRPRGFDIGLHFVERSK